jgi:HK97 family phage portal protein
MFEARSNISLTAGDPAISDFFGTRPTASGQNVTADTAMRTSAVFACITILSQTLAMLPKHVKGLRPDGGMNILTNHRLYKLIHNRPNRWQSAFEFFEMLEGHRLGRGNAYARIVYNPGRQQNELIPMHPDYVWPFIITPSGITYYLYDNSPAPPAGSVLWYQYYSQYGETEILSAEEVLHVRGYSTNGIVGLGVIKRVMRETVGLAMAAEEHGARMFSNGAQIPMVVKHPGKLKDDAFKRLKAELRPGGEYAGSAEAGKTMLLEDGMTIEKIGMTADESQFIETRKFQIEDIARFFNVPLILIGAGDKAATFASAEQFFMSFKVHTMLPTVCRWEGATERDLLYPSEIGSTTIDFDLDSMMRGDAATRATYLLARFNMASITPDEIRAYENENPTDTEEGKKLYLMSGMMPASLAGQKPLAPGAVKDVKK